MTYNEKKKNYDIQYHKDNIKRIPLNVQKAKYEEIKAAAEQANETVNGYIKKSIDMRMKAEANDSQKKSK